MCRNITTLRGLQPEATAEEVEAAARQYVRKVSGVQSTTAQTEAAFELAVQRVARATTELLAGLPPGGNRPPRCRPCAAGPPPPADRRVPGRPQTNVQDSRPSGP